MDLRVIWLGPLSPHWSPGLIQLIWLCRQVPASSLTVPCVSLEKLHAPSKRMTFPNKRGRSWGQGYTNSYTFLLEPPNKFSRCIYRSIRAVKLPGLLSSLGKQKINQIKPRLSSSLTQSEGLSLHLHSTAIGQSWGEGGDFNGHIWFGHLSPSPAGARGAFEYVFGCGFVWVESVAVSSYT